MAKKLEPYGLGELFAGSYGMECRKCRKARTWTVWLNADEIKRLEAKADRDARLVICEEKLGEILCLSCGNE